jgi:hypothetical protein
MKAMNSSEELFKVFCFVNFENRKKKNKTEFGTKLFAWRECVKQEVTSITTRPSTSKQTPPNNASTFNQIAIQPIKTMNQKMFKVKKELREKKIKIVKFFNYFLINKTDSALY